MSTMNPNQLIQAYRNQDYTFLMKLIRECRQPKIDINSCLAYLCEFCFENSEMYVEQLLFHGGDPNYKEKYDSVLSMAVKCQVEFDNDFSQYQIIKLLLENGAKTNDIGLLHYSVCNNGIAINKLLLRAGIDIKALGRFEETALQALQCSSKSGLHESIKIANIRLLEMGLEIYENFEKIEMEILEKHMIRFNRLVDNLERYPVTKKLTKSDSKIVKNIPLERKYEYINPENENENLVPRLPLTYQPYKRKCSSPTSPRIRESCWPSYSSQKGIDDEIPACQARKLQSIVGQRLKVTPDNFRKNISKEHIISTQMMLLKFNQMTEKFSELNSSIQEFKNFINLTVQEDLKD
jgi:ankyrin repeat protein